MYYIINESRLRHIFTLFQEGAKVEGNYHGRGKWYPAKIGRDRRNGTYDLDYNDGEKELCVDAANIRLFDDSVSRINMESTYKILLMENIFNTKSYDNIPNEILNMDIPDINGLFLELILHISKRSDCLDNAKFIELDNFSKYVKCMKYLLEAKDKLKQQQLCVEKEENKELNYITIPSIRVPAKIERSRVVVQKLDYSKDFTSVPDEYKKMLDDFIYIYACHMNSGITMFLDGKTTSVDVRNVIFGEKFLIHKLSVCLDENTL